MFAKSPFKKVKKWKLKDLHKKIGQILIQEPTDSDIQEGQLYTQVWFVDENHRIYLLIETDTLAERASGKEE